MLAKNLATSVFLVVLLVQRIISLTMLPKAKYRIMRSLQNQKGKGRAENSHPFKTHLSKNNQKNFKKDIFLMHIFPQLY